LNIFLKKKINCFNKFYKKKTSDNNIQYGFYFISILSPAKINNIKVLLQSNLNFNKNKKILIKQSYILLTWIYYILKYNNKNIKTPVIFIKPLKKIKFTLIKSPMAHKTFSQEQFLFKFYRLIVFFKINNIFHVNYNQSLLLLLVLKKTINIFESNFFFLQKFNIKLNIKYM
jgi:hypothetical protein